MSVETPVRARLSWQGPTVLVVCVLALSVALTWAFFAMRAVMEVGGACADGGPYVSAQPCPDGANLIAVAIPVLIVSAMVGTVAALNVGAPNLLIPMWGFLFGSLGWNFLEYAFKLDGVEWGWLVCGVMFELMALPALAGILLAVKSAVLPPATKPREQMSRKQALRAVPVGSRWWVPAYASLGAIGFTFGWWSFAALR